MSSMHELFPTQDIGSLAKPRWRVKGLRGEVLTDEDIVEAVRWGKKLELPNLDALVGLLSEKDSERKRQAVLEWSALFAVRLLETAGLDVVFDGEQWRSEMYEHVIRSLTDFKFLGNVKSFDYHYFNKAACLGRPKRAEAFYVDEFKFTKAVARRPVKVPFTGAYTLVDWTFNEYYERKLRPRIGDFKQRKLEARREFIFDMVRNVIRPEIRELVDAGAQWIEIDEPAATTNSADAEMQLFVESFNETVKGFNCTFSLHNCYSNYEALAKYADRLCNCSMLALELANRDTVHLGFGKARIGCQPLKLFEEHGFGGKYGVGVVDVHTDFIESPELVRDRLAHVAKIIGDPARIWASTDCGLRTRTWAVSSRKLRNMVAGATLARKQFG